MADKGKALARQATLQPTDIAAGLGAANRELLATCIALFEDTSLRHRVGELFGQLQHWTKRKVDAWQDAPKPTQGDQVDVTNSVRSCTQQWLDTRFSEAQLRLVLWVYLRDAFELPARTCASTRSAARSCDDLTAALLHSLAPGWFQKLTAATRGGANPTLPMTLDAVARQTIAELMHEMLNSTDPQSVHQREKLMAEVRERIERLQQDDRDALLGAIGANQFNDSAIRKILLTGGSLTLFSASVWWAGFSAYILTAQVSAFIPLVSGPALVSLVSIVSNPISVIAIAGGGGWWLAKRTQRLVSQAVAMRVIALLAMNGLCSGRSGLCGMVDAFRGMDTLLPFNGLTFEVIQKYQQDWRLLQRARHHGMPDAPVVGEALDGVPIESVGSRLGRILGMDSEGLRDTATLSILTIGDVLWQMFAINPAVMNAANFSHTADLGNPADFAAFSNQVAAMDAAAHVGAVDSLRGYVAERLVASQLTDAGYQVEFPANPNQVGWDISVDGVQVQIKDTDSLSVLQKHFDHFGTQYPVIINSEMSQSLAEHHQDWLEHHPAWANHLYVVDGYSNELVGHVTQQSLDAGASINHPHVPMFTLAISAYRNYQRFRGGRITGEQAVQQVLLDGSTKMVLASVGGMVGPAMGLFVFGPAGALVFGTVVPIISQMQSRKLQGSLDVWVTSQSYKNWHTATSGTLGTLVEKLRATLKVKAGVLQARINGLKHDDVKDYLHWRAEDELASLREAWCRLGPIARESVSSVEIAFGNLLGWMGEAPLHPVTYQAELDALIKVFNQRPPLGNRVKQGAAVIAQKGARASKKVWTKLKSAADAAKESWNASDKPPQQ